MDVNGQRHGPAALPPGKEPLVSIGGPQSRSGYGGEDINSQSFRKCYQLKLGKINSYTQSDDIASSISTVRCR
jgi:hypothetical protein